MEWTTETPKTTGWYLAKEIYDPNPEVVYVESPRGGRKWYICRAGSESSYLMSDFSHWSKEPIQIPEVPRGT